MILIAFIALGFAVFNINTGIKVGEVAAVGPLENNISDVVISTEAGIGGGSMFAVPIIALYFRTR